MVVAHEGMVVRVDGQHRVTVQDLPGTGIAPLLPKACDSQQLIVRTGDTRSN